ncbi:SPOR domain-containing protein [Paenibacillus gorillae]|uniref:SPOR domain-containing protein n=1 Tax=Paenibacillus gorillae TaxID=1243662 RepID=UPI0004AFEC1E|nr:SPOR domain-containing protein [Paenibacillus gorillae]
MKSNNRITYRFDRSGQPLPDSNRQEMKRNSAGTQGDMRDPWNAVDVNGTAVPASASPSKTASKVVPIYKESYDSYSMSGEFTPWNTAFQEDVGALEQLIRDTDNSKDRENRSHTPESQEKADQRPAKPKAVNRKAAANDASIHSFNPELEIEHRGDAQPQPDAGVGAAHYAQEFPEETGGIEAGGKHEWTVKRYSAPPSWMKVFLSVAAALATGALFGYLLLNLFTGTPVWPGEGTGGAAKPVDGAIANPGQGGGKATAGKGNGANPGNGTAAAGEVTGKGSASANLSLPVQTYYMLQYGVFSNAEGLQAALADLQSRGNAAAGFYTGTDYRAYTGLAGDRAQAVTLGKTLSGMELYVKQVDVEVPQQFPFSGDAAAAEAFFSRTAELVSMIDKLTLTQLEQPQLSSLSSAASKAWLASHQSWTESVKAMEAGVKDKEGQAFLIKLIQSLNSAAKGLEEYDKKPSQSHLQAIQSDLMGTILTQKQWFESVSAL